MTNSPGWPGHGETRGLSVQEALDAQEDDELRRLHYLSENGMLSERSMARLLELKVRDRRQQVRSPREFEASSTPEPTRGRRWRLLGFK